MGKIEKAIIKEKKLEFWIGVLFLLPVVISTLLFLWFLLSRLSGYYPYDQALYNFWENHLSNLNDQTPVFLGLISIAGVYMVKDSLRYFYFKEKDENEKA